LNYGLGIIDIWLRTDQLLNSKGKARKRGKDQAQAENTRENLTVLVDIDRSHEITSAVKQS
jgi:hypothetical protein